MPISCPGGQVYTIKSGDTLYLLAQRFNVSVTRILIANPGINPNNLAVGQEICIPVPAPVTCPGGITYTIQPGDTLYALAVRYNTTVVAIAQLNPGIDPNTLRIGQVICIPRAEPAPVPRPSCLVLNPTDLTPNAKGAAFIEPDLNSVVVLVTNVPAPTTLPEGEVYKLWIQKPNVAPAVTTLQQLIPGYWMARLVPAFPISGANLLVSAEKTANVTAPAGLGVVTGTL